MRSKLDLLKMVVRNNVARWDQSTVPFPFNLTIGVSYHCNSRCKTCRIYDRAPVAELTLAEWTRVFRSIGESVYWATLSGGEPFLREDLPLLYQALVHHCAPAMVNIPTNGLLTDRIVSAAAAMAAVDRRTQLIINVSLDHYIPEKNDEIRGVPGDFDRAAETVRRLNRLELPNLKVGVHTVISKFNVKEIPEIAQHLRLMLKDKAHYITEIAENRFELGTETEPISPKYADYKEAVQQLLALTKESRRTLIGAFRREYYSDVLRLMRTGRHIPCYAGYASCQITPEGDVAPCCVRYDSMGNLRDNDFDFGSVWYSLQAWMLRKRVRECSGCPLANAYYTNALLDVPTLMSVAGRLIL